MLAYLTPNQILIYYGLVPATSTSRILYRTATSIDGLAKQRKVGLGLLLFAIGAIYAALYPFIGLEFTYQWRSFAEMFTSRVHSTAQNAAPNPNLAAVVRTFNPLIDADGKPITPINSDFSIVIPSIGVNAPVIPGVNPANTRGYEEALKKGVAHSASSYYPSENGTVYLFSHSTNYEWFVKDLNAVFYLLKNITPGNYVVVMYLGDRYTYKIRDKQVVSSKAVSYLRPQYGTRNLILQTCWPPGSSWQRLLIFADLIDVKHVGHFDNVIYQSPSQFETMVRLASVN